MLNKPDQDKSYNITVTPRFTYTTLSGELKTDFEENDALALLLRHSILFINNHWWRKDFTEEQQQLFSINVNVNDIFCPGGGSDAEEIGYNELEDLFNHWEKDSEYGPIVFVAKKRKMLPRPEICEWIDKGGIWDLKTLLD